MNHIQKTSIFISNHSRDHLPSTTVANQSDTTRTQNISSRQSQTGPCWVLLITSFHDSWLIFQANVKASFFCCVSMRLLLNALVWRRRSKLGSWACRVSFRANLQLKQALLFSRKPPHWATTCCLTLQQWRHYQPSPQHTRMCSASSSESCLRWSFSTRMLLKKICVYWKNKKTIKKKLASLIMAWISVCTMSDFSIRIAFVTLLEVKKTNLTFLKRYQSGKVKFLKSCTEKKIQNWIASVKKVIPLILMLKRKITEVCHIFGELRSISPSTLRPNDDHTASRQ